eukprot:COSAG05_NODE_2589_length_2868_cov_1.239075_1_plen_123_part_00
MPDSPWQAVVSQGTLRRAALLRAHTQARDSCSGRTCAVAAMRVSPGRAASRRDLLLAIYWPTSLLAAQARVARLCKECLQRAGCAPWCVELNHQPGMANSESELLRGQYGRSRRTVARRCAL